MHGLQMLEYGRTTIVSSELSRIFQYLEEKNNIDTQNSHFDMIKSIYNGHVIIIIIMVLFYLFIQYYAVLKEISIR